MKFSRSSDSRLRDVLMYRFSILFVLGGLSLFLLGIIPLVSKTAFIGITLNSAPYLLISGIVFLFLGGCELLPFSTIIRPLSFLTSCFVDNQNPQGLGWRDRIRLWGPSLPPENRPLNSGPPPLSYSSASGERGEETGDKKILPPEPRIGVENTPENEAYCTLLNVQAKTLTLFRLKEAYKKAALAAHPDKKEGSKEKFIAIYTAKCALEAALSEQIFQNPLSDISISIAEQWEILSKYKEFLAEYKEFLAETRMTLTHLEERIEEQNKQQDQLHAEKMQWLASQAVLQEAEDQRGEARDQRQEAEDQRLKAEDQRGEARDQRQEAEDQRGEARDKRQEAEDQRLKAEDQRGEARDQRGEAIDQQQSKQAAQIAYLMQQAGMSPMNVSTPVIELESEANLENKNKGPNFFGN